MSKLRQKKLLAKQRIKLMPAALLATCWMDIEYYRSFSLTNITQLQDQTMYTCWGRHHLCTLLFLLLAQLLSKATTAGYNWQLGFVLEVYKCLKKGGEKMNTKYKLEWMYIRAISMLVIHVHNKRLECLPHNLHTPETVATWYWKWTHCKCDFLVHRFCTSSQ